MEGAGGELRREKWRREIDAWRASGLSLTAWARQRGLSRSSLKYWKRRLAEAGLGDEHDRRRLTLIPILPAETLGARPAGQALPIELTHERRPGWCIRLGAGFDVESLARLIELMEARC